MFVGEESGTGEVMGAKPFLCVLPLNAMNAEQPKHGRGVDEFLPKDTTGLN
jgi:hypothetical protein